MSRYWAALPIAAMAGVPIGTAPSYLVVAIEGFAVLLCASGVFGRMLGPVTAGGVLGLIGYAVAVCLTDGGADLIGAAIFGIALLLLLDFSEFTRRLRGAAISAAAMRGQVFYWLGLMTVVVAAIALVVLGASVVAAIVPGRVRAVIAGVGAVIAFAGAVRAGFARAEG